MAEDERWRSTRRAFMFAGAGTAVLAFFRWSATAKGADSTDLQRLAAAWATFKTNNPFWNAGGRCKGWATAYPTEASLIDNYVASLVAGGTPTPPAMITPEGRGLVGMVEAGFPSGTIVVPPPPPPSSPRFAFRGIFCRDTEFAACYPGPFRAMNLTAMECATFAGSSNTQLVNRLNALQDPDTGWIYFGGGFTPSSTGGAFGITDLKLDALMTNGGMGEAVATHPRNSHRYQIFNELNLTAYSGTALQANLTTIRNRVNRIKSHDPLAVVGVTDYRQAQLDPTSSMGAIWKGTVDEVWLDGYPNWVPYQENLIPDLARWCDNAGMPYCGVISCHEYNTNQPAYPTQSVYAHMMDQWRATKASGIDLYIYEDGIAPSLSTDPVMQTFIGTEMLTATDALPVAGAGPSLRYPPV